MSEAPLWLGVAPEQARVLGLFLHGRNQTPEDMAAQVLALLDTPGVAWLLPRAPGKVWYAARAIDPLTPETRAALAAALALVGAAAATLRGRSRAPLLVAGFSQGGCLALEHAFHGGAADAVVALTGTRVGTAACMRATADLTGLPVYLTGSDADPWIPPQAFATAVEALTAARARLRAESFPGRPHDVSAPERGVLDAILADLAARQP